MRYLPGEVLRDRFPWSLSLESEEFLLLVAPDDPPASSTRFRFLLFSNVGWDFLPPVDDTLFFKSLYSSSSLASSSPFIHSRIFFWNKTTEITNQATQLDTHSFHYFHSQHLCWQKRERSHCLWLLTRFYPNPTVLSLFALLEYFLRKHHLITKKCHFLIFPRWQCSTRLNRAKRGKIKK